MSLFESPVRKLAYTLRDNYGINCLIETGTWTGNTAEWAGQNFNKVVTIEASTYAYNIATTRLSVLPNVECVFGSSRTKLAEVLSRTKEPCLFWLDAHFSGGATYGSGDECPLMDELNAVLNFDQEHFLMIDDIGCFLGRLDGNHDQSQWPKYEEIESLLSPKYILKEVDGKIMCATSKYLDILNIEI